MKNKSESIETTCELARAYATIKAYESKYGPLTPPVDNAALLTVARLARCHIHNDIALREALSALPKGLLEAERREA